MGLANWLGLQSNINTDPYAVQRNNFAYGGYENGANDATARLQGMGAQAQQRGLDPAMQAQQEQARQYQNLAAGSYIDTLRGRTPSVAQLQMQQGLQQAQQNAQSMAAGARGGGANQAAAMRSALQANAGLAGQTNAQSGQLRAQEMADARAGLLGAGNAMRGGDFQNQGQYLQNRGANDQYQTNMEQLGMQTQLGNMQSMGRSEELQAQQAQHGQDLALKQSQGNNAANSSLLDKAAGAVTGIVGGLFKSDERGKTGISPFKLDDVSSIDSRDSSNFDSKKNIMAGIGQGGGSDEGIGGVSKDRGVGSDGAPKEGMFAGYESPEARGARVGSFGGTDDWDPKAVNSNFRTAQQHPFYEALPGTKWDTGQGIDPRSVTSDKRAKKGVREDGNVLLEFAKKLDPVSFEYKDPEPGMGGRMPGILAQDMEKSKAGRQAVVETPEGKAVDIKKGLSLALATIAAMKDEIDSLKSKKSKRGR